MNRQAEVVAVHVVPDVPICATSDIQLKYLEDPRMERHIQSKEIARADAPGHDFVTC
jgi:hypothetical protein